MAFGKAYFDFEYFQRLDARRGMVRFFYRPLIS